MNGLHRSFSIVPIFFPCLHSALRRWQLFLYCSRWIRKKSNLLECGFFAGYDMINDHDKMQMSLDLHKWNFYSNSPGLYPPHTLVDGEVSKENHKLRPFLSSHALLGVFFGNRWSSWLFCAFLWPHPPRVSRALSGSSGSLSGYSSEASALAPRVCFCHLVPGQPRISSCRRVWGLRRRTGWIRDPREEPCDPGSWNEEKEFEKYDSSGNGARYQLVNCFHLLSKFIINHSPRDLSLL